MKSVVYFSTPEASMFRNPLYNPNSKKSRESMAEEVKFILIFEEEISDEISDFDWISHPAYIATITGNWTNLEKILEPLGYEVRTIPIN